MTNFKNEEEKEKFKKDLAQLIDNIKNKRNSTYLFFDPNLATTQKVYTSYNVFYRNFQKIFESKKETTKYKIIILELEKIYEEIEELRKKYKLIKNKNLTKLHIEEAIKKNIEDCKMIINMHTNDEIEYENMEKVIELIILFRSKIRYLKKKAFDDKENFINLCLNTASQISEKNQVQKKAVLIQKMFEYFINTGNIDVITLKKNINQISTATIENTIKEAKSEEEICFSHHLNAVYKENISLFKENFYTKATVEMTTAESRQMVKRLCFEFEVNYIDSFSEIILDILTENDLNYDYQNIKLIFLDSLNYFVIIDQNQYINK